MSFLKFVDTDINKTAFHWEKGTLSPFGILMFSLIKTIQEKILIKPDSIQFVYYKRESHKYQLQSEIFCYHKLGLCLVSNFETETNVVCLFEGEMK